MHHKMLGDLVVFVQLERGHHGQVEQCGDTQAVVWHGMVRHAKYVMYPHDHTLYAVQAQAWATNFTFHPGRYYGLKDSETKEMGLLDPLPSAGWKSITIFGKCCKNSFCQCHAHALRFLHPLG